MATKPKSTDDPGAWITTTQAAPRYGIEATTIQQWPPMKGFPNHAKRRRSPGSPVEWHVPSVDDWLRSRVRHRQQRPARWWSVVGINGYPDRNLKPNRGGDAQ